MSQPGGYRCVYCAGVWRGPADAIAHEETCDKREDREAEWRSHRERFERRSELTAARTAARDAQRAELAAARAAARAATR